MVSNKNCVIGGKPGTGKTVVMSEILHRVDEYFNENDVYVLDCSDELRCSERINLKTIKLRELPNELEALSALEHKNSIVFVQDIDHIGIGSYHLLENSLDKMLDNQNSRVFVSCEQPEKLPSSLFHKFNIILVCHKDSNRYSVEHCTPKDFV